MLLASSGRIHRRVLQPCGSCFLTTKPPRRFRQLSQPDNVDSSCSTSCSYRRRKPRGSKPRGEWQKNEALELQGLRSGGDSWTRTNDPIDVNDVLYRLSHATLPFDVPTASDCHRSMKTRGSPFHMSAATDRAIQQRSFAIRQRGETRRMKRGSGEYMLALTTEWRYCCKNTFHHVQTARCRRRIPRWR